MARRFNGVFHQSHLTDYEVCPRMFYFRHVRQLEPESIHAAQFIGQAVHATIKDIHAEGMHRESDIRSRFLAHCRSHRQEVEKLNGNLQWNGDPREQFDEAIQYLTVYASKPDNQTAQVLYAEQDWECQIGRYCFAGRIDQVRRQSGKIILVDFKTSSYRPSDVFLRRSYQLSLYAYALWKVFDCLPDEIWLYHLKDHLPYRRSGSWGKAGTEKGPAIYRTHRSQADLEYLETDVSRICAAIRFGLYFRRPANLGSCNGFCQYTKTCLGEIESPILPASTITTIEEVITHGEITYQD